MAISTIAIAGAGDLAKYVVAELQNQGHNVAVLSRSKKDWFEKHSSGVSVHVTDYSVSSIRDILDLTGASALFSLINAYDAETYLPPHRAMLEACKLSNSCKRFSPAYYSGDIVNFPGFPRFCRDGHDIFLSEISANAGNVEWTVVLLGSFMDYIVIIAEDGQYSDKSYILPQNALSPIDMNNWKALIPGTGDEPAAFTPARDVAKAVAVLATTTEAWEKYTYVMGELTSWNKLADKVESFYGKPLKDRSYRSMTEIQEMMEAPGNQEDMELQVLLQFQEWFGKGSQGLPVDEVERQRTKHFKDIHFRTVDEFLEESKTAERPL